jgi:acyl carrier protein
MSRPTPQARDARIIADNDSLFSTGIVDSLGVLELVRFIEEEFVIDVAEEDLSPEHFGTIAGLAKFVRCKGGGSTSP